ncbi:hypothetical protein A2U01_0106675, partial [Trifolium medium]|nr:hypothetical protein [Trifolium medium]
MLVDKIADGLEEEEGYDFQGKSDEVLLDKPDDNPSIEGVSVEEVERTADILIPVCDRVEAQSTLSLGPQG